MAQRKVYPGGVEHITLTANQSITISHRGDGYARLTKKTTYASVPATWDEVTNGRVTNDSVTFGPYTSGGEFRLYAEQDTVHYNYGSAPISAFEFVPPSPREGHVYFDDFDDWRGSSWTITETQAGATQGTTDGDGGLLALVNSAADDDLNAIQKSGASFLFENGKKLWYECKFKVDDATESDIVVGLQITDTTPLDTTDGVFFLKSDGETAMGLLVEKDNTATTTAGVSTIADDTFVTLGFYYDGANTIHIYENGIEVGTSVTTNLPDDEELRVSFAVQNGEAAARTLTIDYFMVAKER